MRLVVLILAGLLAGCQVAANDSAPVAQCSGSDNLLANTDFGSSDPAAGLSPWRGAQHAGETSFRTHVSNGELTIEKIGTQPWYFLSQTPQARSLRGESLVFRAEIRLDLNAENLAHRFTHGGGLQVSVWGDPDPVMGGDRLVFSSSLEHEPRLGTTDWVAVSIPFTVPSTATRMSVGFLHQANGSMQVRNPGLFRCGG